MRRRKQIRKAGYYLLFKREDRQKVWLYEYLRKDEITARLRDGWKIVPNHSTSDLPTRATERLNSIRWRL